MRHELTDNEWSAIKPMLPNKPRGVPRVNDRRVLNGIFWVLRSGAPWRDLPVNFGPYTTCYNRFARWRRAGVWAKLMSALAEAHDAAVQMIDTSSDRGAIETSRSASSPYLYRARNLVERLPRPLRASSRRWCSRLDATGSPRGRRERSIVGVTGVGSRHRPRRHWKPVAASVTRPRMSLVLQGRETA